MRAAEDGSQHMRSARARNCHYSESPSSQPSCHHCEPKEHDHCVSSPFSALHPQFVRPCEYDTVECKGSLASIVARRYYLQCPTRGLLQQYFCRPRNMRMSEVFQRVVLKSAETLDPPATRGRKRALSDMGALTHIFTILRTGMQWRELHAGVPTPLSSPLPFLKKNTIHQTQ